MAVLGRGLSAGASAVATRAAYWQLSTPSRRWAEGLRRLNHREEAVTLAQGPATALGALVGVGLAPGVTREVRAASLLAVAASGAMGTYDDLAEDTSTKGLRGHLTALSRGQVTSGGAKLIGIGLTGLVAGALSRRGRGGVWDALLAGTVVAGAANLLNLLDLRPGRALKVYLFVSAPVLVSPAGAMLDGPVASATALLAEDLGERSMLGDAGANALGASWGVAVSSLMSRRALAVTAATVVALTVASEKISFSSAIDQNSVLRHLDQLGRR